MTDGSCVGSAPGQGHFHDQLARSSFILHPSLRFPLSAVKKRARRRGFPGRGPFLIPDPRQALLGTRIRIFILRTGNPISRQLLGQCRKTVRQREIGYAPCAAPLVPRLRLGTRRQENTERKKGEGGLTPRRKERERGKRRARSSSTLDVAEFARIQLWT